MLKTSLSCKRKVALSRRTVLCGSLSIAVITPRGIARAADDADTARGMRPQLGDLLVFFDGDHEGTVIKPADLKPNDPPILAWAFDQVAPAPLATISEKYHTPIVAITVTTIVNLIFMALFVFTPWFSKIVILIEAAVLAWSVVLAAGMFFPYLRPELYEKSPIAGKTIFGLPIMTVACFLGFIAAQFYFWTLYFDPNAAGHDPTQVMIVVGVFVLGFAFYYIMKMIRRSQGIDVTLAFKEIPIE